MRWRLVLVATDGTDREPGRAALAQVLTLADLGLTREAISPTIAGTVAASLRALADGEWFGATARWSADQLRALADEVEQSAERT